jgi:type VI protein secretion system component VasF
MNQAEPVEHKRKRTIVDAWINRFLIVCLAAGFTWYTHDTNATQNKQANQIQSTTNYLQKRRTITDQTSGVTAQQQLVTNQVICSILDAIPSGSPVITHAKNSKYPLIISIHGETVVVAEKPFCPNLPKGAHG